MRPLLFSALLVGALTACGSDSSAPAPATEPAPKPAAPVAAPPPPVDAAPVEAPPFDPAATFAAACASCHGSEGKGDGPAAVALNPKPAAYSDAEFWTTRDKAHLIKVIAEGGPSVGKSPLMAPFGGQFKPEEIDALAQYIIDTWKPK